MGDLVKNGSLGEMSELSQLVALGTAAESDLGALSRALSIGMAADVCTTVSKVRGISKSYDALLEKVRVKHVEKLEADIEADIYTTAELAGVMGVMLNRELVIAEFERKTLQGSKELFPVMQLTDEERKILRLMAAFKTVEQKQRFMALVEQMMDDMGLNDTFAEPSVEGATDGADVAEEVHEEATPQPKGKIESKAKVAAEFIEEDFVVPTPKVSEDMMSDIMDDDKDFEGL